MPSLLAEWLQTLDTRLKRLEDGSASAPTASDDIATYDAEQVSEDDIRAAYRLLLHREPDPHGFAMYRTRSASGLTRDDLVDEFLGSTERVAIQAERLVSVDLGGVTVHIDRTEREFGRAIARDKVWEAHIVSQIHAHLSPGGVFVDIGANVGVMSFHAAKAVGPAGKVIAFEPNPDNVQRFLQGVQGNGFTQIRLYPMAASAEYGVFSIRGGSNTHLAEAALGERLVPALPADTVLRAEPRIDLIKIDIEGHEPMALAGLAETLGRHAPTILCEFNPRCLLATGGPTPESFAQSLFDLSSSLAVVEHDGSLCPVDSAAELMALWTHRNAQHVAKGDLEDGMVHFDLLIRHAKPKLLVEASTS